MYGEGISKTGELIDLGVKLGIVEKSGSWFSYGEERIGQGRENAKLFLREHVDIAEELELPAVKIYCSILAEDANTAAIDDYKAKSGK